MNAVLSDWIRRQAEALYDGERCTAFRLHHVALGDRLTPLDRYVLREGEDPGAIIGRVQALAQQHAEAFAGMPQRYQLTACFGDSQTPESNYVWRVSSSAGTLAAAGSEPPTAEGQTAQMMRLMEFLVRSVGEMSTQRFREQTTQTEGMQAHMQWLQSQILEQSRETMSLRLAAEDTKDRQAARDIELMRVANELEQPSREEQMNQRRMKVFEGLAKALLPGVQSYMNAKAGVAVPAELHPLMQRLKLAFEDGKNSLDAEDIQRVLSAVPPHKRPALFQMFQAVQAAYDAAKPSPAPGAPPASSAPHVEASPASSAPHVEASPASTMNGAAAAHVGEMS